MNESLTRYSVSGSECVKHLPRNSFICRNEIFQAIAYVEINERLYSIIYQLSMGYLFVSPLCLINLLCLHRTYNKTTAIILQERKFVLNFDIFMLSDVKTEITDEVFTTGLLNFSDILRSLNS